MLTQRFAVPKVLLRVIALGCAAEDFRPPTAAEKAALRDQFGLRQEATVLCFVGRLNPEKKIELILETMGKAKSAGQMVELLIAGEGPSKPDLLARVQELNLADEVRFLGYLTDPLPVYQAADLLLLPSAEAETFGLVVVEAALSGVPTLRSDTGGAEEQIKPGITGAIFPRDEPAAFHRACADLVGDRTRLAEMGMAAREHALTFFDEKRFVADMVETYESVLP